MSITLLLSVPWAAQLVSRKCTLTHQLTKLSASKERKGLEGSQTTQQYNREEKYQKDALKEPETLKRKARPKDINSEEYANWQLEYNDIQEDTEASEMDIEFKYDSLREILQEEVTRVQAMIDQEMASLQSELEAVQAQYEKVSDASSEADGVLSNG